MPEQMAGVNADLSQRLSQRMDTVVLWKESVGDRRFKDTGLDDEIDRIIVAGLAATATADRRFELEEQTLRISWGALIPEYDHDRR